MTTTTSTADQTFGDHSRIALPRARCANSMILICVNRTTENPGEANHVTTAGIQRLETFGRKVGYRRTT